MGADNYLSCIKEVISRYDVDKNGLLNSKETFCFLQGFWGPGYAPNRVPLVRTLYTNPRYEAKDVQEPREGPFDTRYRGNIPLSAMLKYCEDELAKSEECRLLAQYALMRHGYKWDEREGQYNLTISNPPPETYQTLCMYLAKRALKEPNNFPLQNWLMEVTNSMHEYRERPNKQVMEILVQINGHEGEEARWDNLEAQWLLDEQIARVEYIEPCKSTETIHELKWTDPFTAACKEIFARYDRDGDGKLREGEMRLFQGVLNCIQDAAWGQLPNPDTLASKMRDPTLEAVLQEAIGDEYQRKGLVKFVLWHGYGEDLQLLADANQEPITMEFLITRLCQDVKHKGGKAVNFEVVLLSSLIQFLLGTDDLEDVKQPDDKHIRAIAVALDLPDLLDIFQLKWGEINPPTSAEEALQIFTLAYHYMTAAGSQQIAVLNQAQLAVYEFARQHPTTFIELLTSPHTLEQLDRVQTIDDYFARKVGRSMGGRPESIVPRILGSLATEEERRRPFADLWELMDPATLVTFAVRLSHLTRYHGGFPETLLHQVGVETAMTVLDQLVKQKIIAREFVDFYYCRLHNKPYPAILPSTVELCQMTTDQIEHALAEYCGIPQTHLDEYFSQNGMIAHNQSISEVILADAKCLQALGVDHKSLAAKFIAVLDIGTVKWQKQWHKQAETYKSEYRIQKQLGVDVQNLPADFPFRVVKVYTGGHHQDVFHPSHSSGSYYLEYDTVGGSADCMIINLKLLSAEHQEEVLKWTYEDITNLLEVRLNEEKKAEWEDWNGILYCSDMNPYLIRVACCFEGEGTRYRVDPTKLCRILELI